jgi:hypothetical protein
MKKSSKAIVLALAMILLLACQFPTSPRTPTREAVTMQAAALRPSATPALSTTATGMPQPPTSVPSPTLVLPVASPAPTSLNASGPFVIFTGEGGTWITNPDGSFPTRLSEYGIQGDLRRTISPRGDRMAIVVRNDAGLDLLIVHIPGGETETIAHLISMTPAEETANVTSDKAFALYAIRDDDSVAWQPGEGRLLAFTGAINGPTADLYVYDTQTREITQLTSGPSQAVLPDWSPEGEYILHAGVSWVPPFGGAIAGANKLNGVWSVRVSDGEVLTMPTPVGVSLNLVGWLDDSHYITYDSSDTCFSQNLRSVDVASGETEPIMDHSFYYAIAQSPENGALLFSSTSGCSNSLGEGVYLLFPGQTTPTRLLDQQAYEIYWMAESNVFDAYPEALLSPDGQARYDPPVYDKSYEPALSKNGYQAWEVIENQRGRVEVKVTGGEWQTIMDDISVSQLIWDPLEGQTLLIALDDGSLYAASYPDFSARWMGNLGGSVAQAVWTPGQ